jgi:alanine racemase
MKVTGTTAHINLTALLHNFHCIKKFAPTSRILAMVKSDAYRHGAIAVAKTLNAAADAFGVACVTEALQLRDAQITKPIVLLKGFINNEELQAIVENDFETVIHNQEQLQLLENFKISKSLKIWLKIDTGMHRLGFLPHEVHNAYSRLMQSPYINKPLRIMSHLSDASDQSSPKNLHQMQTFQALTKELNGEKCLANSGTFLALDGAALDWIRPGITLYGVSPFNEGRAPTNLKLEPIMNLTSTLISVKHLKQGETVGYSSTWTCPKDMPIGIVNTGYGDGYPRHAPSGTPILINDVRCQIIGRIAMDMITVDLRNCPTAKVGDEVILWGPKLPIEEIANSAGTIPYELFCHLTNRVNFVYYKD